MAAGVPPPPLNSPAGSYYWLEWYTKLTNFLNGTNIPWSNLNFSGSNLTDIQTRNHNDLQNIQGGSINYHYHMIAQGYVDSAIAAPRVPLGWTVTHPSAGHYVVTHSLNLIQPNYMVGATSNTVNVSVQYVDVAANPNAFTVVTVNTANVATDGNFSFWISVI